MKYFLVLLSFVLIFSCQNEQFYIAKTNNYSLRIAQSVCFNTGFMNTTSTEPLHIEAERIKLKDLINTIFKNDTLDFKYSSKNISEKAYIATIRFKNDKFLSKKSALDFILKTYNLKYKIEKTPIIALKIVDTIKIYKYSARDTPNNKSKIYKSKDSISLENISLKKISEIINEEFKIYSKSNNTNTLIDYDFKFNNLTDVKKMFKRDLGIEFQPSQEKQTTYIISK